MAKYMHYFLKWLAFVITPGHTCFYREVFTWTLERKKEKKKDWFNNQRKLKSILLFDDKEN